MKVTLKVWRQKNRSTAGGFKTYTSPALNENMSFLEMLDVVNEELANQASPAPRSCRARRSVVLM